MRLVKAFAVLVIVAGIALVFMMAPGHLGFAENQSVAGVPVVRTASLGLPPLPGQVEIGVSVRNVRRADVSRLKLPRAEGVIVTHLVSGGPAAKAGVQVGDVIMKFDGETVRSVREFARLVEESVAGRAVTMHVVHDGATSRLEVTPEAQEFSLDSEALSRSLSRLEALGRELPRELHAFGLDAGGPQLGVTVEGMTPALAAYFGAKQGVLVTSIATGSPAAKAHLQVGDVITAVEGREVGSRWAFMTELQHLHRQIAVLTVIRHHKDIAVRVHLREEATGE